MDGDIAPLPGLVEAAEAYDAAVMVDDAHASGRPRPQRPGHGRSFRAARPRRDPGRHPQQGGRLARRLRRGLHGPARDPDPASAPVPLLDLAPAGRGGRLSRGDPGHGGRAGAPGAAVGQYPALQGGVDPPRASIPGRSETPITPVMMGDPDTAGRFSDRLLEEGVFAQPVVFPTVAIDKSRLRTIVTAAHADRAARHRPGGVRPGRPRARAHQRVTVAPAEWP